jgi:hypothetical protein
MAIKARGSKILVFYTFNVRKIYILYQEHIINRVKSKKDFTLIESHNLSNIINNRSDLFT